MCQFLKFNAYTDNFISNIVNSFLLKKMCPSETENLDDSLKYTFKIPYVCNPSLIIKKKIQKIFKVKSIKVNVVFSTFKIGQYFSLKDGSKRLLRSSLIYTFECLGDPSKSYIEKTKRYLNKRIIEHLKPNSAMGSHISKCNHCNSQNYVNYFKVIDKAQTDFDLQILEALHITDNRP